MLVALSHEVRGTCDVGVDGLDLTALGEVVACRVDWVLLDWARSSAPVRPGMKPRRAEISRPATADPYARRPESRARGAVRGTCDVGVDGLDLTALGEVVACRVDWVLLDPAQAATTKGRPKKLDLSKSKSHNDLMAAASRARSGTEEAVTH
jgi:CLIP-associating protein 1/2